MANSSIIVADSDLIELGEIRAAYGIKGWLKVFSYSRPVEQIFSYKHWLIGGLEGWDLVELEQAKVRSNGGLLVKFINFDERDIAVTCMGKQIAIKKAQLAQLEPGEYYWSQLIGLNVINDQNLWLGQITSMLETGANDVMVVKDGTKEQLIPYADTVIVKIDLEQSKMMVAWDVEE